MQFFSFHQAQIESGTWLFFFDFMFSFTVVLDILFSTAFCEINSDAALKLTPAPCLLREQLGEQKPVSHSCSVTPLNYFVRTITCIFHTYLFISLDAFL